MKCGKYFPLGNVGDLAGQEAESLLPDCISGRPPALLGVWPPALGAWQQGGGRVRPAVREPARARDPLHPPPQENPNDGMLNQQEPNSGFCVQTVSVSFFVCLLFFLH